jgi:hypothetical protein
VKSATALDLNLIAEIFRPGNSSDLNLLAAQSYALRLMSLDDLFSDPQLFN